MPFTPRDPREWLWLRQVHGRDIVTAERAPATVPDADGAVTATVGLPLVVMTADCAPIALVALDEHDGAARAVGVVHAGWQGLLEGGTDGSLSPLPIRFLQGLGDGKLFGFHGHTWRAHPKFQLSCGIETDFFHLIGRHLQLLRQTGIAAQEFNYPPLHALLCPSEDGSRIHQSIPMFEKGGYAQSAHRLLDFRIFKFIVIIDNPIHGRIRDQIDFPVIQRGNAGEYHTGTIRLHPASKIFINVLQEMMDGNFLIRIVSTQIDASQRNKPDLRVCG